MKTNPKRWLSHERAASKPVSSTLYPFIFSALLCFGFQRFAFRFLSLSSICRWALMCVCFLTANRLDDSPEKCRKTPCRRHKSKHHQICAGNVKICKIYLFFFFRNLWLCKKIVYITHKPKHYHIYAEGRKICKVHWFFFWKNGWILQSVIFMRSYDRTYQKAYYCRDEKT